MKTQITKKQQNNKTLKHYIFKWSKNMSHHTWRYFPTTDSNYVIMAWYVTTSTMSDVITQQHTMHYTMVCCNNRNLLCHSIWCHMPWHSMHYVTTAYNVIAYYFGTRCSMSQHAMLPKVVCHSIVCHNDRYCVMIWYVISTGII